MPSCIRIGCALESVFSWGDKGENRLDEVELYNQLERCLPELHLQGQRFFTSGGRMTRANLSS